jgi:hypothetical protein
MRIIHAFPFPRLRWIQQIGPGPGPGPGLASLVDPGRIASHYFDFRTLILNAEKDTMAATTGLEYDGTPHSHHSEFLTFVAPRLDLLDRRWRRIPVTCTPDTFLCCSEFPMHSLKCVVASEASVLRIRSTIQRTTTAAASRSDRHRHVRPRGSLLGKSSVRACVASSSESTTTPFSSRLPIIRSRFFSETASSPQKDDEADGKAADEDSKTAERSASRVRSSPSSLEWNRKSLQEERRKARKRREREAMQQQSRAQMLEQLTYRSEKEFDVLFNQIAPSVAVARLRDAVRRIKALQRQSSTSPRNASASRSGAKGTRSASTTEESNDEGGASFTDRLFDLYHGTPPNDRALKATLAFLLSESIHDAAPAATAAAASVPTATSPAETGAANAAAPLSGASNKKSYVIELLLQARKRAWQESLAWDSSMRPSSKLPEALAASADDENRGEHAALEAEQVVSRLATHVPTKKRNSFFDLLEAYTGMSENAYAVSQAALKAQKASARQTKPPSAETSSPTSPVPDRLNIKSLSSQLKNRLRSHYHLVAPHIATFFGFDVEQTVELDVAYVTSHEKWRLYRNEFSTGLLHVQDALFRDAFANDPHKLQDQHNRQKIRQVDEAAADDDPSVATGDEGDSLDDLHPSAPDAPIMTQRRIRRPLHAVMEALFIHEVTRKPPTELLEDGSSSSALLPEPSPTTDTTIILPHAPTEATVFLDNLPIDITSKEVTELYGRCGDVASVRIFNQRPELDPGPLSHAQLMARRRSRTLSSFRFKQWQRPRSPVYAVVTFESTNGYEACVNDSLRIFGMLIQKHPVRSIRASDMTRLYLEGIHAGSPGGSDEADVASDDVGIPCLDLEYQLREHLSPDIFVCLDARQNHRSMVGSCEIRFPSFEAAKDCFVKLHELPLVRDDPGCTVQWMPTPKDATDWLTRKRGFD